MPDSVIKKQDFDIFLTKSLESERIFITKAFQNSLIRIANFSKNHDWKDLNSISFIKEARIFDSKLELENFASKFIKLPDGQKFPETFCAALEKNVFFSVSPNLYSEVYPDGREPAAFEKLISHEIAHRLHVSILNAKEEEMGPIWFFEGFAIYASDQFENALPELTDNEIWQIVESSERGSYKKYASVVRFFLNKTSLENLVAQASRSDFVDWLRNL